MLRAFNDSFTLATEEWRLEVFRAVFGFACVWKFAEALRRGGWRRLEPDTFARYQLLAAHPVIGNRVARIYKPALILRFLPALGVMLGVLTKECLVLVIIFLLFELSYDQRKHPVYFIVLAAGLLFAGHLGHMLQFDATWTSQNTWAQWLIAAATFHVYWNSVWIKLHSPQFRSGRALSQLAYLTEQLDGRLRHREYFVPAAAWRRFSGGTEADEHRWRLAAGTTVVIELLLPVGLLCPPTYPLAAVVGAGMHAIFTSLKPRALIPFSLVTTASYLAFAP